MLAYNIASMLALALYKPGMLAMHNPHSRRSGNINTQLSWEHKEELLVLKDILMEASVNHQLEHFRDVNNKGLVLWLSSEWVVFNVGEEVPISAQNDASSAVNSFTPGQMEQFMDKLMHAGHEYVFVPTHTLQQGTQSNPYLQQRAIPGYQIKVEPAKIAQCLMACREQLTAEWREDLTGIASGHEAKHLPHIQRLAILATRVALRPMLHDLSLLPSHYAAHNYLENLIVFHADVLGLDGNADALITQLEQRPLYIAGRSWIDPPQLAAGLRLLREDIAMEMAQILAATSSNHRDTKAGFLEACFNQADSGRFRVEKNFKKFRFRSMCLIISSCGAQGGATSSCSARARFGIVARLPT